MEIYSKLYTRQIWLTVNKHNTHSIEWYLRMGFTNKEAIVQDIGAGFVMDDFLMEKFI
jgi:ribosomal protein S18 acetylase RimI-like enzyme